MLNKVPYFPFQIMDLKPKREDVDTKTTERSTNEEVEGVPLLIHTTEKWSRIWEFQARPDDVLICTYPRAGKL